MGIHQWIERSLSRKLIAATLVIGLTTAGPSYAAPRAHQPRSAYPAPGKIVPNIPAGHAMARVGKHLYQYHGGVFYRKGPKGFTVVRAPMGASILRLPLGYRTLIVAGVTYFLFAGVYYQKNGAGYVVVDAPPTETQAQAAHAQVEVATHRLNVRSGPGKHHPVTRTVSRGQILLIRGHAPDWYYVQLASGDYGWVMSQYTRSVAVAENAEG